VPHLTLALHTLQFTTAHIWSSQSIVPSPEGSFSLMFTKAPPLDLILTQLNPLCTLNPNSLSSILIIFSHFSFKFQLQTADVSLPLGSQTVPMPQPQQFFADFLTTIRFLLIPGLRSMRQSRRLSLQKLNSCPINLLTITSWHRLPENCIPHFCVIRTMQRTLLLCFFPLLQA
jgi:hypothetical protein